MAALASYLTPYYPTLSCLTLSGHILPYLTQPFPMYLSIYLLIYPVSPVCPIFPIYLIACSL